MISGMAGGGRAGPEHPISDTARPRCPAFFFSFLGAIRIDAPGGQSASCTASPRPEPEPDDVMRGEEKTQLMGVTEPEFNGLVCIPRHPPAKGQHEAGRIVEFSPT